MAKNATKQPWFYGKNGDKKYVTSVPTTITGKTVKEKPVTHCGGLHASVGFSGLGALAD